MKLNKKKTVAWKMSRLDPNDSDALKKFVRFDRDRNREIFSMPEGTYKNSSGRFIRQHEGR